MMVEDEVVLFLGLLISIFLIFKFLNLHEKDFKRRKKGV